MSFRRASSVLRCAGLSVALSLAAASVARGQARGFDVSRLSDAGRKAFALLLKAEFFSVGGVGYAGRPSEAEEALRVLLAEREALEALRSLAARANPEGKLYALLGLRSVARRAYDAAVAAARVEPVPPRAEARVFDIPVKLEAGHVRVMEGCFVETTPRADILKRIDSGYYDKRFD
ncbi:MAG TPA: hypothetical protein VEQ42_01665 [Pyrinomonadaceae bacterium]|nr:hypothetical protein [Pyrinomonadaceae bacterium]